MILVTGATSAVGKATIKELLARKASVRAFVRKSVDAVKLQAQGMEVFLGDMTKQANVAQALQGIESVYLITPVAEHLLDTEMLWAQECKKASIHHLVKQSEIGADPQSFSPLLQIHGKAESAIRASGVPYTILRTLFLMQNFELMYAQPIITQGVMYAPLADMRMSYVDARDIGAVAAHLLGEKKYQSKEYDVTGPEAITCTQLAEIFSSLLHTPVRYVPISDEEAEKVLLGLYSSWAAHAVTTLLQFYRQGGGNFVTSVVDEVTGHKPCTATAFISEHIQSFQATKENPCRCFDRASRGEGGPGLPLGTFLKKLFVLWLGQ
ncbi:NmrA family NAD(P)-binding protein [Ktedonospora formicarum]|uniref:NAD(P)-dependent oxidoreductase n=1 Tax=Ktedonospora formicarum TaxID=2778364 RepID=A0A8J3IHN1_9CHLR|nr:NmrA family NAD(P)-binding protein [Ktedonospora formicarum]GHO51324.1 NAD(P)-dependent oxidoreductase [Ktedonospora formicarum]